MQLGDPDFELGEDALVDWAEELGALREDGAARSVLELNVSLHSQSTDALTALGRVLERLGERQAAIERYKAAIALYPYNAAARKRVSALSGLGTCPKNDQCA
jgi:tetratricopeptide (TPR) repeat protein